MGKELAESKNTALPDLAKRLSVDTQTLQDTLKATVFQGCKTNEQFISAVIIANTYKLNPLLKELYAFPSKGGGVIPVVSIDGWISLVNRQESFDGVELIENIMDDKVESITCKIYHKDRKVPTTVTEYMQECMQPGKEPWKKWPIRMLRHKAYIQCARVAFGFSGIYDEDEADRIKGATEKSMKPEVTIPVERIDPGEPIEQPVEAEIVENTKPEVLPESPQPTEAALSATKAPEKDNWS